MERIKLGNKMKVIPMHKEPDSRWVLCACNECENEFIVKLAITEHKEPIELWDFKPLVDKLNCPYCNTPNIYAEHFPKVDI